MAKGSVKNRLVGLLLTGVLFSSGMVASPAMLNSFQTESNPEVQEALTELENRVAGLEARVTSLENSSGPVAEVAMTPTLIPPTEVPPATHTLNGSLTIYFSGGHAITDGMPCKGKDSTSTTTDYSGFHEGTRITVSDGSGSVVATGEFQAGTTFQDSGVSDGKQLSWTSCVFVFKIEGVPDSDFYSIEIDGFDGDVQFSKQELEDLDWTLVLG